jgi:hypothetical protein
MSKPKFAKSFKPQDVNNLEGRVNGIQYVFRFKNGYGASVVCHDKSYGGNVGLWEIATIKFAPEGCMNCTGDWEIIYDTGLCTDVLGWQSEDEVIDILKRIKNLEK